MKTMMQEVPFRACALAAALGVMGCGSKRFRFADGGTKPTVRFSRGRRATLDLPGDRSQLGHHQSHDRR